MEVIAPPLVEAQRVDAFGSLSTEVGTTQVRDLQALDLSAALRRTPGVNVSRFNPVGSFGGDEGGAVYVRGLGASRPGSEVKTFVDGLPFYMGVWNHALLDLLPVHGMERIRVLKGPQPQALGNTFAAIDMLPLQAKEAGVRGNLRLMGGVLAPWSSKRTSVAAGAMWICPWRRAMPNRMATATPPKAAWTTACCVPLGA
ncbi:TonB-dependent receptor [Ideonella paludis]|uniref:TonB-dependent receptor n=1 Tax=Ideonella paludis TaxID=1233411 RepID=UPI003630AC6E